MERVTSGTFVQDLLEEHRELIRVFERHGILPEVQCLGVTENTLLEDAAAICNFDLQGMMKDLNQALEDVRPVRPD